MGRDKALLAIEGIPLLRRVCDVALQCTSIVYVITFRPETYRSLLPPNCHLIQEQARPNETEPHGPLLGFAQALETLQNQQGQTKQKQTDWVLLLACDMPRLSSEALQQWIETLEHAEDEIALLPRSHKGWEPLCGFYRTSCLASLQAAIAHGDRSFQRWLSQEFVKALPLDDTQMLFNCNTPQDLERVLSFEF